MLTERQENKHLNSTELQAVKRAMKKTVTLCSGRAEGEAASLEQAGKAPRGGPFQETPEGLEEASFGESLEKFPGQREWSVQKPQGEEWAGGQQGCS